MLLLVKPGDSGVGCNGSIFEDTALNADLGMMLLANGVRPTPAEFPVLGLKSVRPGTALKFPFRKSAVGTVAMVGTCLLSRLPS